MIQYSVIDPYCTRQSLGFVSSGRPKAVEAVMSRDLSFPFLERLASVVADLLIQVSDDPSDSFKLLPELESCD